MKFYGAVVCSVLFGFTVLGQKSSSGSSGNGVGQGNSQTPGSQTKTGGLKSSAPNLNAGSPGKGSGQDVVAYQYEIGGVPVVIKYGAKQTFQVASFTPPAGFVLINPGEFQMGEYESHRGTLQNADGNVVDVRKRKIVLTREFWMCNHEVTQGEYKELMVSLGKKKDFEKNPSVN